MVYWIVSSHSSCSNVAVNKCINLCFVHLLLARAVVCTECLEQISKVLSDWNEKISQLVHLFFVFISLRFTCCNRLIE